MGNQASKGEAERGQTTPTGTDQANDLSRGNGEGKIVKRRLWLFTRDKSRIAVGEPLSPNDDACRHARPDIRGRGFYRLDFRIHWKVIHTNI